LDVFDVEIGAWKLLPAYYWDDAHFGNSEIRTNLVNARLRENHNSDARARGR